MVKIPQGRFIVEEYEIDQWCVSWLDTTFEGKSFEVFEELNRKKIVVCGENRNQCVEFAVMMNSIIGAA